MYESYHKKMKKLNASFEKLIEEKSINYDSIQLDIEKIEFEFKLLKRSLLRKVEYYKNNISSNLLDSLENENIQDIIERANFEISFEEKKLMLNKRKMILDLHEVEYELLKLNSELSIQNDRNLGIFD